MAVKKGYKQTEVGVIPEDWEIVSLSQIARFSNGKAHEDSISDYGAFIVVNSRFISTNGDVAKYSNRCFAPAAKGNILMVMSDVPNGRAIAKCFIVDCDNRYTVNQRICSIEPTRIDGKLLFYKIDRNPYYLAFDDGVKQTNLRKNDVLTCPLAIPLSGSEQSAIAQSLSDADAWIESLEQLIAKKRQIKQGAMQELLTGKRRLPGFNGEWDESKLIDIAEGRKELFDDGDWIESEHITSQGIRLVQTGNIGVGSFIEKDDKKYIYESSFVSLGCKEIKAGDLLVCRLAEPAGRACVLPDIGEAKVVTSVDVTIFRPPPQKANRVFLANVFSTSEWFREVSERTGGTTHKRISRGALGRITIRLPKVEEQLSIANFFADMDTEIDSLESKLAKAREIKQGMMQELLTGRIRLVPNHSCSPLPEAGRGEQELMKD